MNNVSNENYIVIQGWMINDLKLKGNELVIYAIIYGFSQAVNHSFNGSLQYLADWTNSTRRGVQKNLASLVEKGFLTKNDISIKGIKMCEYSVCFGVEQSSHGCRTKFTGGVEQSSPDVWNKVHVGVEQSSTNNTNNITNNKLNNIYIALIDSYTQNDDLKRALINLVEMRQKQKGFTVHALELILKKLDKLSERDDTKIEIINNTVMNSWKGIYPVKNKDDVPDWFKDTKQDAADPVLLEELQNLQKQSKGPIQ